MSDSSSVSVDRAARAAMLRARFADTILKAKFTLEGVVSEEIRTVGKKLSGVTTHANSINYCENVLDVASVKVESAIPLKGLEEKRTVGKKRSRVTAQTISINSCGKVLDVASVKVESAIPGLKEKSSVGRKRSRVTAQTNSINSCEKVLDVASVKFESAIPLKRVALEKKRTFGKKHSRVTAHTDSISCCDKKVLDEVSVMVENAKKAKLLQELRAEARKALEEMKRKVEIEDNFKQKGSALCYLEQNDKEELSVCFQCHLCDQFS